MSETTYAQPLRIAMWSGPRNLSTAMMRSFGARRDTVCLDEPFYAAYLALTSLDHPLRSEILAHHEADPQAVAQQLSVSPATAPIVYQKHMTHHMVEGIPRDWMRHVQNVFLIRHPARVLASYARKMETVSLEAIGFPQQAELYDYAASVSDRAPYVLDSDHILQDPQSALSALCADLGIAFDVGMLTWPPGPKPEDGIWAPHWYDAVNASSGFAPAPGPLPGLPAGLQAICDAAMPIYEKLSA